MLKSARILLGCVAVVSLQAQKHAGTALTVTAGKAYSTVSQDQLDEWTRKWRQRLEMSEWLVITQVVRIWELKPETLGNVRWDGTNHTATIKVLNPLDYGVPSKDAIQDIECTILHELIHLQLSVLPRIVEGKAVEEKVVTRLAAALMKLEYPGYKPLNFSFLKTRPKAEKVDFYRAMTVLPLHL